MLHSKRSRVIALIILVFIVGILAGLTARRQDQRRTGLPADPAYYGHDSFESIESRVAYNLAWQYMDRSKIHAGMGDLQRAASLHEELLENLDRYPLRSRPAFMGIFNTLLRGWVVNSLTTLYLAANRPQKALALITKNLSEGEVEMRGRAHLLAGRSLDAMGRREEAQREYSASLELVNRAIAMLGGATLDTLNILPADPAEGMRRHARLRALYALWADPLDERYYWGYWRPGSLRAILDREKKAVLDARAGSSNVPARHSDQAGKGTGALTTVYLLGKPAT